MKIIIIRITNIISNFPTLHLTSSQCCSSLRLLGLDLFLYIPQFIPLLHVDLYPAPHKADENLEIFVCKQPVISATNITCP